MKSSLRYFFLLAVPCLFSTSAFGALTYISMSGVSNRDETVLTKPIGYAGLSGTCPADIENPNLNTCNTCTGAELVLSGGAKTKYFPCNKNSVHRALNFVLRVSYTQTGLIVPNNDASLKVGTDIFNIANFSLEAGATNVLNMSIPWESLCNEFGTTNSTNVKTCSFDKTFTLELTSATSGSSTESMTFRLIAREVSVDTASSPVTNINGWFYQDCKDTEGPGSYGFCHFEAYPGDAKVYANDLVVSTNFPTTGVSGIEFSKIVFFYAPYDGVSEISTLEGISNSGPSIELAVNRDAKPPISDNRIEGLSNGQRYCFIMGNQDVTGNISFLTPPISTGGATASELCATPSEVVGLLDDKECFIATAAFGSVMAPEVQSFRDFRDQYLLPNAWGKRFVQTYYKYSPEAVHHLAQSEFLRTTIRIVLWPVLWFAQIALQFGLSAAFGVMLSGILGFAGLLKLGRRYL